MFSCHKKYFLSALIAIFSLATATAGATKHMIQFGGNLGSTYSPKSIPNVHIGDTIEWAGDFFSHPLITVSVPAGASDIAGPTDGVTQVYDYVVKVVGSYNYECSIHGAAFGMTGSFDVSSQGVNTTSPIRLTIEQNSPNPAMRMTHIPFTLTKSSQVAVRVVDEEGVVVKEIPQRSFTSGRQMIMLDVTALTSGAYFYELVIDGAVMTKEMIVNH
jgi:plastocyanin